jgi:hypothetical protein
MYLSSALYLKKRLTRILSECQLVRTVGPQLVSSAHAVLDTPSTLRKRSNDILLFNLLRREMTLTRFSQFHSYRPTQPYRPHCIYSDYTSENPQDDLLRILFSPVAVSSFSWLHEPIHMPCQWRKVSGDSYAIFEYVITRLGIGLVPIKFCCPASMFVLSPHSIASATLHRALECQ